MSKSRAELIAEIVENSKLLAVERYELPNTGEQWNKCWAKIEEWAEVAFPNYALEVDFVGPYKGIKATIYCCRLPNGYSAKGNSRLDALAHAAQWCEHELAQARFEKSNRGQDPENQRD